MPMVGEHCEFLLPLFTEKRLFTTEDTEKTITDFRISGLCGYAVAHSNDLIHAKSRRRKEKPQSRTYDDIASERTERPPQ